MSGIIRNTCIKNWILESENYVKLLLLPVPVISAIAYTSFTFTFYLLLRPTVVKYRPTLSRVRYFGKQVQMYYRSGTGVRRYIGTRAHRHFVFTRQAAALFCAKSRHRRHLENYDLTSSQKSDSVNRCIYLREDNNKMRSGRRSVTDPK